jgi:hypothetical protein
MLVQLAGIHDDITTAIKCENEAVQAARRWAIQILAIDVVVGAVTWAFETVTVIAEWHLAAEVDTDLIERQPV